MSCLYRDEDKKRLIEKDEPQHRSAFRRDNGRLIHSASFRRLQGKTQLFPSYESDFFRNRLTHSLEVAQIAKGIAEYINESEEYPFFKDDNRINLDLVETAALAHDLGHPPFGHNGEKALDNKMKDCGGFEGNAQTLRILTKLEKKEILDGSYKSKPLTSDGKDNRGGLNCTYRTLASVLKYDDMIPKTRDMSADLCKGYYYTEEDLVNKIKNHVIRSPQTEKFKTIECHIMDVADDIAYCTYDLEDALKAEFLSPLKILTSSNRLLEKVAKKACKYCDLAEFKNEDVLRSLKRIFHKFLATGIEQAKKDLKDRDPKNVDSLAILSSSYLFKNSEKICCDGYHRTHHTSEMVHHLMSNIKVEINDKEPALSVVSLKDESRIDVEVLKHYNYEAVIDSARLRISEYRGQEIVETIFDAIADEFEGIEESFDLFSNNLGQGTIKDKKGPSLLPEDFRRLYDGFAFAADKNRAICDFIACMTDRYAIEFYGRLKSENPQTIFKPL